VSSVTSETGAAGSDNAPHPHPAVRRWCVRVSASEAEAGAAGGRSLGGLLLVRLRAVAGAPRQGESKDAGRDKATRGLRH
jgi:hypothetical protein